MIVKWTPFGSLLDNEVFSSDFISSPFPSQMASFEPRIDIRETEKTFELNAELPGLSKDNFKLTLDNDHLILEGEKKHEHENRNGHYYRTERSYGAFKRTFKLTDSVNKKKIRAAYRDGILRITLPKSKEAKPKAIEVNIN